MLGFNHSLWWGFEVSCSPVRYMMRQRNRELGRKTWSTAMKTGFAFGGRTHGALLLPLGGRKVTLRLVRAQLVGRPLNKKSLDQCLLNVGKNYSMTLSHWSLIPKLHVVLLHIGGKNRNSIWGGQFFLLNYFLFCTMNPFSWSSSAAFFIKQKFKVKTTPKSKLYTPRTNSQCG